MTDGVNGKSLEFILSFSVITTQWSLLSGRARAVRVLISTTILSLMPTFRLYCPNGWGVK